MKASSIVWSLLSCRNKIEYANSIYEMKTPMPFAQYLMRITVGLTAHKTIHCHLL